MSLRRTQGIVTDRSSSDPTKEADVIMTAAALGLAADYIATERQPLQYDMDPLDAGAIHQAPAVQRDGGEDGHCRRRALDQEGDAPAHVRAGLSPGYWPGAMIMGVYVLAGQEIPQATDPDVIASPLVAPVLSVQGQRLLGPDPGRLTGHSAVHRPRRLHRLRRQQEHRRRHRSHRAAVDGADGRSGDRCGRHTIGALAPAGRTCAVGTPAARGTRLARAVGVDRRQRGRARSRGPRIRRRRPTWPTRSSVRMRDVYGMVFADEPTMTDIATYTHGMIQAVYKAYALGPSCRAVRDRRRRRDEEDGVVPRLHAVHVRDGISADRDPPGQRRVVAPLYAPYNPNGPTESNERGVIRDLNNAWSERCGEWVSIGLDVLDDAHIAADHRASRDAVSEFMQPRGAIPRSAATWSSTRSPCTSRN